MADYYACTELEPLIDEIRKCFAEADQQQEPLSLTLSNSGRTYRYVLQRHRQPSEHQAQEVAGKALEILREGLSPAPCAV